MVDNAEKINKKILLDRIAVVTGEFEGLVDQLETKIPKDVAEPDVCNNLKQLGVKQLTELSDLCEGINKETATSTINEINTRISTIRNTVSMFLLHINTTKAVSIGVALLACSFLYFKPNNNQSI